MDRPLILDLARRYMEVAPERTQTENVRLRCPLSDDPNFHPPGDKGSLTFSVEVKPLGQSRAFCFRCRIGGSLIWCFEEAQKSVGGFEEVITWLHEVEKGGFSAALTQARLMAIAEATVKSPQQQARQDLERYVMTCHRRGMHQSMIERGLIRSDYERWRIGFDPEARGPGDVVGPRSTFPVWDHKGNLVGVSRRAVGDLRPKFADLPYGRWKADVFYGEHLIDTTREEGVLVEGVVGTVVASRWLPNTLGVLGSTTKIDGVRLDKLRSWFKRVVLLYDADRAGREAVYGYEDVRGRWHDGLRDILKRYMAVRVGVLPPGGDPDSVRPQQLIQAHRDARGIVFDNSGVGRYDPPPYPINK